MPFETMGQKDLSTTSCFLEEIYFSSEKEHGFWEPRTMHYCQDGKFQISHRKSVVSLPLEKLISGGALSVDCLELPPSYVAGDQKDKYHTGGQEGLANFFRSSGEFMKNNQKAFPSLYGPAVSYSIASNKTNANGTRYGNSSSLSEVFGRKLGLSMNNVLFHKSADAIAPFQEEEEPLASIKENEAQTIGTLLPDEDDLFSGVIDELEYIADAKRGDNAEDFDLFSNVGGPKLEVDMSCAVQNDSDFTGGVPNGPGNSNGSIASAQPHDEHRSRTLFVRNINCNVEDSELRVLFEQYGDIRYLYTACKHRGFVMISYFDTRAARGAMQALQNKLVGCRNLDIHYSIPKDNASKKDIDQGTVAVFNLDSSISNDDLRQIFGVYGEIKEIRETPRQSHHKFIEFYDIRAAEAACHALNKFNIAGKRIRLEPSFLEGTRQSLMQNCSELKQDDASLSRTFNDISLSEATVYQGVRTVGCFNNGSVQGLHFASNVPLSTLTEDVFHHGSSCILNSLPSPLRVPSAGNHIGLHSLDQVKFGGKCIASSQPHSFPDCPDNGNIFVPHNSSSNIANMVGKVDSGVSDRMNASHLNMVSSDGQPMELQRGVSGPSRNDTPVHGHQWSISNSFQHHPSSPMVWTNSSSFSSGVVAPCISQVPGFSGISPDPLNSVSPPYHFQVGSAPSISPALWNRPHTYPGESPEVSAFCLGSIGSVGFFPGSSPLHPLGRASHVFSHASGNGMENSTNDALHSPHHISHICPGRKRVTLLPTSFGYPHECGRNLSQRRNQGSSSNADKKQFELDIDRILHGEDHRTTLMIKNIPNKYTSKMLLTTIDEHCRGTYDFIYLPIDFKNKCNVGYAFINLIDPQQIIPFYKAFNGKKWEKFNSEKVVALAYGRIQGKAALVTHFQNSSLMNEDKRCRPILFCIDGPNAGEQEPFPIGINIRSKAGKARGYVTEENHHRGSPSTSVNGGDFPNRSDDSSASAGDLY
ncbi:protein MEI2-like 4 isoform X1 [Actinidia eriantha]|uniref:protein MEI2-like 4 isoform X1 n=1 Tax=Actinidia eriantha TaxID=165200 RepID=UPI0025835ADD|nr:protein MEI2-like 4 isoform X1 [Actinidia eriantha]XP_057480869.1 protein MEI2-like 4 isoform X1 [Actinidia eriantha]